MYEAADKILEQKEPNAIHNNYIVMFNSVNEYRGPHNWITVSQNGRKHTYL